MRIHYEINSVLSDVHIADLALHWVSGLYFYEVLVISNNSTRKVTEYGLNTPYKKDTLIISLLDNWVMKGFRWSWSLIPSYVSGLFSNC